MKSEELDCHLDGEGLNPVKGEDCELSAARCHPPALDT